MNKIHRHWFLAVGIKTVIPLPLKPKIIKKEKNKAVFEIEALYPGYGVTIGNSLRRVLLSSLPGGAVTQMKIKGVLHEFSTIPGVLEDVVTIMLNLKQLRFKVFSDEPQKATLKVRGEREVKASDFEYPPQVEIINKNTHIATLTDKKAELEMEVQIERGVGYLSRETRREKRKPEIGVIWVDAIFTPIRKVATKIENMRVGERTDYDRLFLEIETDGTIEPQEAFKRASEILKEHFEFLAKTFEEEKKETKKEKREEKKEEKKKKKETKKKGKKTVKKKSK